MSVFKVDLNNQYQGYLDLDPKTGIGFEASSGNPSVQRSVYLAGPNGGVMEMKDGATFTDSNYWKRFAYPQVPASQAFITVLTDDGSAWSDVPSENVFPQVFTGTASSGTTTLVDFTNSGTASFAQFAQITNNGAGALSVSLNALSSAAFPLANGATQIFSAGDVNLGALGLTTASGSASSTANYQVIASIRSISKT
jgi:hypothetical protein